jgi:2'-5' RNA ligase
MEILKNCEVQLFEYLLIISPDGMVWQKIMTEKKYFFSLCQATMALYGKPHITLANFMTYDMGEHKLVEILKGIGSKQCVFEVSLKNYNHFKTHTIYADIENKLPFNELTKMLKANAYNNMKSHAADRPFIGNNAHLTIARRLEEWQFEKAWKEYANKKISEKLIAEGMYLLRRPAIEKSKYEVVEYIQFGSNLPTNIVSNFDRQPKKAGGAQLSFFP